MTSSAAPAGTTAISPRYLFPPKSRKEVESAGRSTTPAVRGDIDSPVRAVPRTGPPTGSNLPPPRAAGRYSNVRPSDAYPRHAPVAAIVAVAADGTSATLLHGSSACTVAACSPEGSAMAPLTTTASGAASAARMLRTRLHHGVMK